VLSTLPSGKLAYVTLVPGMITVSLSLSRYADPKPAITSDTAKMKNASAYSSIPKLCFLFRYQETNLTAKSASRAAVIKLVAYAANTKGMREYWCEKRIWITMRITFAANMYWAREIVLCNTEMNLDLALIELLDEYMNFSRKLCPKM